MNRAFFQEEFVMSQYKLALSSFCFFLGVSLLFLSALAMPHNAFGNYDECMSACMAGTGCNVTCYQYPGSKACLDCTAACDQQCAQSAYCPQKCVNTCPNNSPSFCGFMPMTSCNQSSVGGCDQCGC